MRLLLRGFSKFLLMLALLAAVAVVLLCTRRLPSAAELNPAPAADASRISAAELQSLLQDAYQVATSRFIQPDLLWVTFHPGVDVQASCDAIARVWSHRSGLPWVRVESWEGKTRLAQATATAE